jgi:hypothetical protein
MTSEKMLRHLVLFRFKDGVSEEQVTQVGKVFLALPDQINTIQDLEWGSAINETPPYTHCLLVTVRTEEDLQVYDKHPAHSAVGENYGHLVQDVVVFDFWAKE